ncbi:MAG: hypothetical protein ACYSUB_01980 [Planctomycetota bacterium]|jgi:hypothetical protein
MIVYDNEGNMINKRAAELSQKVAQQVGELFESLFAEGMTVLEGRALEGYLEAELAFAATISMMYQQIGREKQHPIQVKIWGKCPRCLDEKCLHSRECANHTSAGDFRTEDGSTPNLTKTDEEWVCTKLPLQLGKGAVLVDRNHVIDWKS